MINTIDTKGLNGRLKKKNLISHGILRPNQKNVFLAMLILFFFSFTMLQAQVTDTVTISVHRGWNLISVPLVVADNRTTVLFPNAKSSAYSYQGGYIEQELLTTGKGYWLKFDSAEAVTLSGTHPPESCIPLVTGWNLIGTFPRDIESGAFYTEPLNNLSSSFYGFNGHGYYEADTLKSGYAYWIKANNTCVVTAIGENEYWELVTNIHGPTGTPARLTFHPTDSNTIYASLSSHYGYNFNGMIMKTTNRGERWDTLVRNVDAGWVLLDPVDAEIAYVSCGFSMGQMPQILKTTNGGMSWFRADAGMPFTWEVAGGVWAINPLDHNLLYGSVSGFTGGFPYKSTNGGSSWHRVIDVDTLQCYNEPEDTLCYLNVCSYVTINPQNPKTVFARAMSYSWPFFFVSYDAAETWQVSYDLPSFDDQQIVFREIDPKDTNIIYVSNDHGLFKSTNGGKAWNRIDSSFPTPDGHSSIIFTDDINTLYVLYFYDHKIFQTNDGGVTWFPMEIENVWGIDKDNFGYLYASKLNGIYRMKLNQCHN